MAWPWCQWPCGGGHTKYHVSLQWCRGLSRDMCNATRALTATLRLCYALASHVLGLRVTLMFQVGAIGDDAVNVELSSCSDACSSGGYCGIGLAEWFTGEAQVSLIRSFKHSK
jgi:hypothetical protein